MKRTKQIDIKAALALAGCFNFLYSLAKACVLPFLTLYFRHVGLTPAMTGIIIATKHLISLAWSPLANVVCKHCNKRRMAVTGLLVCTAVLSLVLPLIPSTHTLTDHCNASDVNAVPPVSPGRGRVLSDGLLNESPTLNHSQVNKVHLSAVTSAPFPPTTLRSNTSNVTSHHHHHHHPHPPVLLVNGTSETNTSAVVNHSLQTAPDTGNSSQPSTPARKKRSGGDAQTTQDAREGEKESPPGFLGILSAMDVQQQLFVLLLITVSAWQLASSPLEWAADEGLYEYLDFADASDRYDHAGLWGLLGAACGVGGAGLLVSRWRCAWAGGGGALHFYCYSATALVALPVATLLPLHRNRKRDKADAGLRKAAQLVRAHPRALLCAVTVALEGAVGSAVDNFLPWEMQDHGSGELHVGACLAASLLSHAAFPLLAGRVSRLLSPGRVLLVAAVCLALQCLYYSFLWGPWAVLPAQWLSCLSSGALWWTVRVQCEDVATPGAERSVRRMYRSVALDLGAGLGSLAGGFVVQRFGAVWLFRGAALGLMLWCLCLPLLQWKAPQQRRINYSRLLAAEASEASDSESEQERDWLDTAMEDEKHNNNNYGWRVNH